jgi:hypothetical protein
MLDDQSIGNGVTGGIDIEAGVSLPNLIQQELLASAG